MTKGFFQCLEHAAPELAASWIVIVTSCVKWRLGVGVVLVVKGQLNLIAPSNGQMFCAIWLQNSCFVLCTFQLKARTVRWWSQVLSCGTNTKAYERYTCWDHHHDRDHYHHHWHTSWCHQPTSFVIDHPSHFVISPVIISWYHHSTDFVPVMWWYQWSKCRL